MHRDVTARSNRQCLPSQLDEWHGHNHGADRVTPGGKMKKFAIALPVLATALAMTPAALADSYTYTISGSNFSATLYLTADVPPENSAS
jgi:hypothetical protein